VTDRPAKRHPATAKAWDWLASRTLQEVDRDRHDRIAGILMGLDAELHRVDGLHPEGEGVGRGPDVERALTHLSVAAVEAELGIAASGWKAGEVPNPAWWGYRNASEAIKRAEHELIEARRHAAVRSASGSAR
jgi:hypothetical protein